MELVHWSGRASEKFRKRSPNRRNSQSAFLPLGSQNDYALFMETFSDNLSSCCPQTALTPRAVHYPITLLSPHHSV